MTETERALLWLAACTPFDYRERVTLLHAAKRPEALFHEFEKFSNSVLKGGKNGVYNNDRATRERETDEAIARLKAKNRFAVTYASEDYPASLKAVADAPIVLFGEGNRELLKKEKFCIVGSRMTPPWAEKAGKKIAGELTEKFVIVTGLAEGGDSAAIAGALESGKLICVMPCGLDECYPASHAHLKAKIKEKGLLLSEFPFGERVQKGSFHARNRILAALSEGVLIISAGLKSGTVITANRAFDYGRDLFVFPYNLGVKQGEGCNELIKKGAYIATDVDDIFFQYGFAPPEKQTPTLGAEEARIMEVLSESGELHAAVIAEKANMQIYEAAATLSSLEIKGLVIKSGGNKYSAL